MIFLGNTLISQLFIRCGGFLVRARAGLTLFSVLFLLVSCVGTDGPNDHNGGIDRVSLRGAGGVSIGDQGADNREKLTQEIQEDKNGYSSGGAADLSEFSSDYVLYVSISDDRGQRPQDGVQKTEDGGQKTENGYLSRGFSSLAGSASGGIAGIKGAGVGLGQAFVTDLVPTRGDLLADFSPDLDFSFGDTVAGKDGILPDNRFISAVYGAIGGLG